MRASRKKTCEENKSELLSKTEIEFSKKRTHEMNKRVFLMKHLELISEWRKA